MSDCRYGVSPVNYLDPDPVVALVQRYGNFEISNTVLGQLAMFILRLVFRFLIGSIRPYFSFR